MVKETIIPKSNKQTDVGVIPDDWQVKRLSDIAKISRGASPRPIEDPRWFDDKSEVGWVRISDVTKSDKYLLNTEQKLSLEGIKKSRPVNKDNLIMSICATVGRPIITKIDVCIHDGFVVFDKLQENKEYTYYYLSSIENKWSKHGQTGSQMNLNTTLINNEIMILPKSLVEQTAIASALRDTDELIRRLEDLITKKRNIKQGAMQELLTGKKRLPGFSGKWETKQLGDIFEITSSKRVFQHEWKNEGVPFYRARELAVLAEKGNVKNELFITKEMYKSFRNSYGVPKVGDMLVTGVGTLGKVYVVADKDEFYFKDGNIIWFKIDGKMSSGFLKQLYLTPLLIKQITDNSTGTTVGTYTISVAMKTVIPVPSIEEQTAIAQVLSDMDTEIDNLEQKLDKYKMIKQGMMQELLTGRTRLI